ERLGNHVPRVTPEEAGRTLARIAGAVQVTLFAHYDTDHAGHRGGLDAAVAALEKVDAFLAALAAALPDDALLVVASDHGNLEDARGGHTRNSVPVIAAGPGRDLIARRVRGIADVTPALLEALGIRSHDATSVAGCPL
ncbi:MAG TPA: alkaline phosphatase family protein, partial [Longimicrobium sp.]|nr:alkaline phosphatase family protein [Longimicrobium sp.]